MSALARWLGAVAVLAGCGRFGFPQGGPDGGVGVDGDVTTDAAGDASTDLDGAVEDGPLAVTCPEFAILCDDFESGDLAQWTRLELIGPAALEVNTTSPRTGAFALEATFSSSATNDGAAAPALRFPPVTTGMLATRIWINLASPLQEFSLVTVFRNHLNDRYASAGGNNTADWVSTEESASGLTDHHSTTPTPPLATWTCVELVYTFPTVPTPGRIQVFVDDAAVVDVTADDTAPAFTEVMIGIARGDEGGFHVFVDDVVIADQRIGC